MPPVTASGLLLTRREKDSLPASPSCTSESLVHNPLCELVVSVQHAVRMGIPWGVPSV